MGFLTDLAIPIGGALLSAHLSSKQTAKAEKSLASSNAAAIAQSERQYQDARADREQLRADTAMQRETTDWALKRLQDMATGAVTLADIPGYEHRLAEGDKALMRQASAMGMIQSGRTAKELMRWGQGHAADEWNNEWNRLASMARLGQAGFGGSVGAGAGASGNISTLLAQQGTNAASIAGANNATLQGTIQNVTDAFSRANLLNRIGAYT